MNIVDSRYQAPRSAPGTIRGLVFAKAFRRSLCHCAFRRSSTLLLRRGGLWRNRYMGCEDRTYCCSSRPQHRHSSFNPAYLILTTSSGKQLEWSARNQTSELQPAQYEYPHRTLRGPRGQPDQQEGALSAHFQPNQYLWSCVLLLLVWFHDRVLVLVSCPVPTKRHRAPHIVWLMLDTGTLSHHSSAMSLPRTSTLLRPKSATPTSLRLLQPFSSVSLQDQHVIASVPDTPLPDAFSSAPSPPFWPVPSPALLV